jgi:hypothetical protein
MEQHTNQKPEVTVVQQRPVTVPANLNGDFAAGLRTMPKSEERPDYARGQESHAPVIEGPDFARGERLLPLTPEGPDYARGLRQTQQ